MGLEQWIVGNSGKWIFYVTWRKSSFRAGAELTVDVMPIPSPVQAVPGRSSSAEFELVFLAPLPPMGFANFYITRATSKSKSRKLQVTKIVDSNTADFTLSNGVRAFVLSSTISEFVIFFCI